MQAWPSDWTYHHDMLSINYDFFTSWMSFKEEQSDHRKLPKPSETTSRFLRRKQHLWLTSFRFGLPWATTPPIGRGIPWSIMRDGKCPPYSIKTGGLPGPMMPGPKFPRLKVAALAPFLPANILTLERTPCTFKTDLSYPEKPCKRQVVIQVMTSVWSKKKIRRVTWIKDSWMKIRVPAVLNLPNELAT
jgi:hypothetical protein